MAGKKSRKKAAGQKNALPNSQIAAKKNAIEKFFERHTRAWLWLSGFLPVGGLLIIYISIGIYPFGEKSVANVDMMQQYIPFYASLKNVVFGGGGLEYSTALGMGGSYWGLIGYYLTSPFAWLSLLVPNDRLPDYMAVQELVKVGLAGMTFAYFCSRKFRCRDLTVPLLSLCYALSAFFLTHLCTVIWSDCLVLLPLIVWGLEELLRGKKPWLYILCLSLSGISNYYFAMMIGAYLVLYAVGFLFTEGYLADGAQALRKAGMFAACSLLSVGIAAGILLPSALLVSESGNAADRTAAGFWAMNPLKIIPQLLYHADNHILSEASLPLLYCSLLPVICLPLFFLCKEISSRVKIALGTLAAFIMLSLAVNWLNYLWHGAHIPNKMPFRFAFLLVFTLLIMAGTVMEKLDSVKAIAIDLVLFGVMAVTVAVYFVQGAGDMAILIGTLLPAIGYTVLLVLRAEKQLRHSSAILMALILAAAELTSYGVTSWKNLSAESPYYARKEYISRELGMSGITEKLTVSDSDVYRISMLTEATMNSGALTGHGGMSCFSSTNNGGLMNLLYRVGYNSDRRVTYYYKNFTPLMDSVMNVKYVAYDENAGDLPYLQPAGSSHGFFAYRNTLALPRAFAVSDSLLRWNPVQDNPFEVQNDFARKAVSDGDLTVYEPLPLSPDDSLTFGATYREGSAAVSEGGRLVLTAVSESRRHLYAYIDCPGAAAITVTVGKKQFTISEKDAYVIDFGWLAPENTFTIAVSSSRPLRGRIYAALLNEAALEKGIAGLAQSPAEFRQYTETDVCCEIEAEKGEMLFTSIPYEKGWRAEVNGKPADIVPIGGGLIGLPLNEGNNTVELRYTVPGMKAGILLSLMSIAAAVWLLFRRNVSLLV